MRTVVERLLAAAALLLSVLFLAGAAGWMKEGGRAVTAAAESGYYHGGKDGALPPADPGCRSASCHPDAPHGGRGAEPAFRNMHAGFMDCLACHGVRFEERWAARRDRGGLKLSYGTLPTGVRRHELNGKAAACRSCHSEDGRNKLLRIGAGELPGNFASPIALRMIEEKGKRWITGDIR